MHIYLFHKPKLFYQAFLLLFWFHLIVFCFIIFKFYWKYVFSWYWFSYSKNFRICEPSTCFFFCAVQLFLFLLNLDCSIILLWLEGNVSSPIRYSYLSILSCDNADIFATSQLILYCIVLYCCIVVYHL